MDVQVNCSKAREWGAVAGNHELGEITIVMNKIKIMMNMIVIIKMMLGAMMTIFIWHADDDYGDDDNEENIVKIFLN